MNVLELFGQYVLMLSKLFVKPENFRMYLKETFRQMYDIGIGSLSIIAIISTFIGAVTAVQFVNQIVSLELPIPMYWMGSIVRDSMVLEMAPTVSALLLAGKVGSNIASELGTMRITEQIDALKIMGVNVEAYLIGPKILGGVCIILALITASLALGILGGLAAGVMGDFYSVGEYIQGLQSGTDTYYILIMYIKSVVFMFIITSVSCQQGFYVKGGALELGKASTRGVVYSSIVVIIANFLIAFVLL